MANPELMALLLVLS